MKLESGRCSSPSRGASPVPKARSWSPAKAPCRTFAHSPRKSTLLSDEQAGSIRSSSVEICASISPARQMDNARMQFLSSKAVAAIAAASIAGAGLIAPMPGFAQELKTPHERPHEEQQQLLHRTVDSSGAPVLATTALQPGEAPALVSNSSDVLMQAAKDAVISNLPDLSVNSMTAIGGPVVVEPPETASSSDQTAEAAAATEQSQPQQQQQLKSPPPPQQQQQQTELQATVDPVARMKQGLMPGMWQAYCHALETSPLATKIYTGIVGTFIGDLAAQIVSYQSAKKSGGTGKNQNFKFDATRSFRLCLFSAAVGTPMGHYEYALLEHFVVPGAPTSVQAVAAKVCLDQFVQTPFGMAMFFAVMKCLEGKPHLVKEELSSKLVPALLANWKLWPAAQLVNFTVIPTDQRILFGNVVGICWTCIISNLQQDSTAVASVTTNGSSDVAAAGSISRSSSVAAPGLSKRGSVALAIGSRRNSVVDEGADAAGQVVSPKTPVAAQA